MKIALFIGGLYGGGAERVMCNLANHLFRKGHEIDIITMSESKSHYVLESGVHNSILLKESERKGKIRDSLKRFCRLSRYIRKETRDCYVVMLPITTILLLLLSNRKTAPIIAAERGDPSKYSRIVQLLLRKLANRAQLFVFQTETVRDWYKGRIKDCVVIPNAINEQFIREEYTGNRKPVIVGAGRLTEQKNFSLLITAFARVASEFPEYNLIIYGKGPKENELLSLVKSLDLSDRVSLPGQIDNMPEEMEKASMFVLSSDYEGMPNVLMEAMALGLPCVSTDCDGGGAKFLIENDRNGLLVSKNDADALYEAIVKILKDHELAKSLGHQARRIIDKLNPDKIYDLWEQTIASLSKHLEEQKD